MKRVSLDTQTAEIQQFITQLPLDFEGVEIELHGRALCKVIPSIQFAEAEKESLVRERWELIRRAQERNKGVPAKVIERDVLDAVEEVRQRQRQPRCLQPHPRT